MADLTLRLIWYKLGEVGEKMAEAGRSWYTELDFDSYVLDLLLLGWVSVCLVTMLAVNTFVSAIGPPQKQPKDDRGSSSSIRKGAPLPIETCQWFSNAVNWFYLHYYHTPDFVEEWVRSLNEQLTRLGGPVQTKIEKVLPGSLPPKVTHVSCEASPQDRFIIHAKLESWDLCFQIFTSQQTQEGVKLTKCTANILRLKGMLRMASFREGADVKVSVSFETKPEIKVMAKPQNPYQEAEELVDLGVVEENIRNALSLATTTFNITHLLMPGDLQTMGHDQAKGPPKGGEGPSSDFMRETSGPKRRKPMAPQQPAPSMSSASTQPSPRQEGVDETIILANAVSQQHTAPPSMSRPAYNNEDLLLQQQHQKQQQQQQLHNQRQQYQRRQDDMMREQQLQQHLQQQQLQQEQELQLQQQPVVRREQRVRPQSRPEGIFEPVEAMKLQSTLYSTPPKPPRMVGEKRLLVKVIKANGLALRELGSAGTVCIISTDEPVQGYGTSIVKNTCHPFWDEHFIFDVTQETTEVRVEVYDKGRSQDDFVGEAIVYVEDLRKTPSSRQILRLHPQPGDMEYNAGTVTAEFLFMDPGEADLLLDSMTQQSNAQLSPRRRIEVARSMAPGGTLVTTTTTTTERPPYGRHEPGLDGSPNYIEKSIYPDESPRFSFNDTSSNVSSETIPVNGVSSVAATALRELKDRSNRPRNPPAKSGTIIITGVRRTIESTPPTYDNNRSYPGDPVPSDQANNKDKKKGGFGSTILKRFGRKKRAQSADRTLSSSFREGSHLRPPEQTYGSHSKDDLELVRRKQQQTPASPNLKKSRTLGGSLKKLFKRGRKRSQGKGDHSRESSTSRGSHRGGSKNASRDNSLTRHSQREYEQRASSVS